MKYTITVRYILILIHHSVQYGKMGYNYGTVPHARMGGQLYHSFPYYLVMTGKKHMSTQRALLDEFLRSRKLSTATAERFGIKQSGNLGYIEYPVGNSTKYKRISGNGPKYYCSNGLVNMLYTTSYYPSETVFCLNGEPAVWAAEEAGIPAFSGVLGEGTLPASIGNELRSKGVKKVVIIADKDKAGEEKAQRSADIISSYGIGCVILRLPNNLPEKSDFADVWIAVNDKDKVRKWLEYSASKAEVIKCPDFPPKIWTTREILETQFPPRYWKVESVIPDSGLVIIHGTQESAKSLVCLDMAISLATPRRWLGEINVKKSSVLWIDEEMGVERTQVRLKRLGATPDMSFMYLNRPSITLSSDRDMSWLYETIEANDIDVVFIDTIIAVNDFDEMQSSQMRELRRIFKPITEHKTVIAIAHDRKSQADNRVRAHQIAGSRELSAMADSCWQLSRKHASEDIFTMICSKSRDSSRADNKSITIVVYDENADLFCQTKEVASKSVLSALLERRKQTIIRAIANSPDENGMLFRDIVSYSGYDEEVVDEIISKLIKERLVYISERHKTNNRFALINK